MGVQVLVAAMNQKDHSLLEKMNIRSDVIVGNQCDFDRVERFDYRGNRAVYLNFAERGVGLNRNNALIRAEGDLCTFADDDMRYTDGYVAQIQEAFDALPQADVIVFNLRSGDRLLYRIPKTLRLNRLNYLRYGAAGLAVRRRSIQDAGICFHPEFGGGTAHAHGEDSIFLTRCLDRGLKLYACPQVIASLEDRRGSTWFQGYNEKYFRDQGALYRVISPRWWKLLCLQDAVRHEKRYAKPWREAYRQMVEETER